MNILVTGGAGYIGSHIVHMLAAQNDIVVYDSLIKGHAGSLPESVELVKGCLSDTRLLDETFALHKFDAVIHLAAFAEVGESMKEPEIYFKNNVVNSINLLSAMRQHNVKKIVFASSAAVYGEPKEIPITENHEKNPTSYYGMTKLMMEQVIEAYAVYGIKGISLRFFNAAGAGFGIGEHHDPESHLVPIILQAALGQRESIHVYGSDYPTKDGTCIRDYIHVLDIAKAHKLALKALGKGVTGSYNLGTCKGNSVLEVINMARGITGKEIKAVFEARRAGDPAVLVASNQKAKEVLGWTPEYGLKEIIRSAWEWHSSHPRGFGK